MRTPGHLCKITKNEFKEFVNQQMTQKEIAKLTGFTQTTISQRAKQLGVVFISKRSRPFIHISTISNDQLEQLMNFKIGLTFLFSSN